jgi:L-ornithine Nalpha-acyltransferase
MNTTSAGFRLDPDADFGEIRAGNLGVRIARSRAELDAAQALRYRVFYEEMGAQPDATTTATQRDRDAFDDVADHVLVIDHELGDGPEAIVGTSRLIRRGAARRIGRFYTEGEYDIGPLLAYPGNLLELGRFCIASTWRSGGTIQLLWRGMGAYIFKNRIDLLFGCASLPGTDLDALSPQLTYLWHRHLAPETLRACALPHLRVPMDRMDPSCLDLRAVPGELPPLLKSYLRLGGFIGDGAVLDRDFNTTDVCIVVPTHSTQEKYYDRFYRKAARDAGIEPK